MSSWRGIAALSTLGGAERKASYRDIASGVWENFVWICLWKAKREIYLMMMLSGNQQIRHGWVWDASRRENGGEVAMAQ